MHYMLLAIIVLAVIAFFSLVGSSQLSAQQSTQSSEQQAEQQGQPVPDKSIQRAEIAKRLKVLAESPAPTQLRLGAQCYEPMGPNPRAEYTCPTCGEKTLYVYGEVADNEKSQNLRYGMVSLVEATVPGCRRLIKGIKGIKLKLDESQLCQKCRPNIENPQLVLIVRYSDESKEHRTEGISVEDIQLIQEFLSGKNKHVLSNDAEHPLKNFVDRLEQLLGVKVQ